MRLFTFALLVFMIIGASAHAAGFGLDDQSARAAGMMNAMTAHVDDASALFFNPAGMIKAGTIEAQVGDTMVIAREAFTGAASGKTTWTNNGPAFPPHAYLLYNSGDASVGIGFFTPFGASISWPSDFEGRFQAQRSSLATYNFNPQAAFKK
jgi:long-chain fatty acid transport protein